MDAVIAGPFEQPRQKIAGAHLLSALAVDREHCARVGERDGGRSRQWLACESWRTSVVTVHVNAGRGHQPGPVGSARLSAGVRRLRSGWEGMDRREEPPRYESGLRALGSNQQFHRLLSQAVARALTAAPSLIGLSPAAPKDSHPSPVAAQGAARNAVAKRVGGGTGSHKRLEIPPIMG